MGYSVTGLVARGELLRHFSAKYGLHAPINLTEELAILPLRDDDLDSFIPAPQSGHTSGFIYLSEQLTAVLRSASADGAVLYFETDYFGGTGSQGAAVFDNGSCVFGPEVGEIGPINRGLRLLGVTARSLGYDEFEAVGLNRHRYTADWLGMEDG